MNEGGGDEWRWMTLWIWISLTEDKYWKCFLSISLLYFRYWYPFAFLIITIIVIVRPLRDCRVVLLAFFTSLNLVNPRWSSAETNIQSNIRWLSPRLVRGTRSSRKYIYCWLNALSAHSDPTNIGAASDQRSSSSSAATAGARRSFRFDYLSEQSEIGVTSGLVQKWCTRPTWHTTEIRHPQPFGRPSFIRTSLYTSGSGAPEGPRHLASIRPRPWSLANSK